jgi:MFS transporter, DHA1 family, multidrug resistance protein
MSAYIKDSIFGITVNYLTNHRFFPYPEEKSDFQIPPQFLPPNATSSQLPRPRIQSLRSDLSRASTLNDAPPQENEESTKESDENKAIPQDKPENLTPDDIEKAINGTGATTTVQLSDPNIVGWYSDNDPENPQ